MYVYYLYINVLHDVIRLFNTHYVIISYLPFNHVMKRGDNNIHEALLMLNYFMRDTILIHAVYSQYNISTKPSLFNTMLPKQWKYI